MSVIIDRLEKIKPEFWMNILKQSLVATFVAFLFMRITLAAYWSPVNRFYFHWQRSDALAVFIAIFVMASIFFAGYKIIAGMGRWGQFIAQGLFVLITTFYIKVAFFEIVWLDKFEEPHHFLDLIAKISLLLVILLYVFYQKNIVEYVSRFCLVFSPIILIYAITLLTAHPVRVNMKASPVDLASRTNKCSLKVNVVIFDAMSYRRIFKDSKVIEDYPNLERLAQRSFVFHDAHSVNIFTADSLPSIICGVNGRRFLSGDTFLFKTGSLIKPHDEYDHIFKQMKMRGYKAGLIGNYLPYAELFHSGVDKIDSVCIYKICGKTPALVCVGFILDNLQARCSQIPGAVLPFRKAQAKYYNYIVNHIHKAVLSELRENRISFLFAHYSVPHYPFIFDRVGQISMQADMTDMSIASYQGNLRYVDTLLGQIINEIEESAWAKETMLIVTSDHAFFKDPYVLSSGSGAEGAEATHVPLFVHLPGQNKRVDFHSSIRLDKLATLITSYLDLSCGTEDEFLRICDKIKEKKGG